MQEDSVWNFGPIEVEIHMEHSDIRRRLPYERKLVALLSLFSCCFLVVVWLFLAVSWVCLLFVIVLFPDHTHLLFFR